MDPERTVAPSVCRWCRHWTRIYRHLDSAPTSYGTCERTEDTLEEDDSCEHFEARGET